MKYLPFLSLLILVSCTESKTSNSSIDTDGKQDAPSREEYSVRDLPKLINTTDSVITHDKNDFTRVLVSHPKKAKIIISERIMQNANLGFCGELKNLEDFRKNQSFWQSDVKKWTEKLNHQEELMKDLISKLDKAREERNTVEVRNLEAQIYIVSSRIRQMKSSLAYATGNVDFNKGLIEDLEHLMEREFTYVNTEWISDWDKNLETLRLANPAYDFGMDQFPAKVKMVAKGLEQFPAHKMIRGFQELLGIQESKDGLTMEFIPYGLKEDAWLTAYAACPYNKPEDYGFSKLDEMIIDLEFEF